MATIVSYNITIDDTAPQITYLPLIQSNATAAPNLLDGWTLNFLNGSGFNTNPGQIAAGQSVHVTAKDGAALSIAFTGTGIQLYGLALRSTFSVSLNQTDVPSNLATSQSLADGSDSPFGLLASFAGLAQADHVVTLTTHTISQDEADAPLVIFDQAVITASTDFANATLSTTINDDGDFQYTGNWIEESFPDVLFDGDQTVHLTNSAGDQAVFTFQGVSVKLDGLLNDTGGSYEVLLSSDTDNTAERFELSSFSSFFTPSTLFYASGLDPSRKHNLTITNTGNSTLALRNMQVSVVSGGVPVNAPPAMAGPSRFSRATIAAIAVASVLAFILLIGFIVLFLYNRRRRRRRREIPLMQHNSLLYSPVTAIRPTDQMVYSRGVSIDPFSEEAMVGDGNTVESESGHDHGQKTPVTLTASPTSPTSPGRRRRRSLFGTGGLLRSPVPSAPSITPISIPRRVLPPHFLDTPRHSPFRIEFNREGSTNGSARFTLRTPRTPGGSSLRAPPSTAGSQGRERDRDGHVSFLDIASSAASSIRRSSRSSRSRSRTQSRRSTSNNLSLQSESTPMQSPLTTHITNEDSEHSRIASTGVWSLSLSVDPPVPGVEGNAQEPDRHPYSSPDPGGNVEQTSPTDSLPLSVSDINFRVDEEDDTEYRGSSRQHLPPHPPLPITPPTAPTSGSLSEQHHQRQESFASTAPTQPQAAYVAQTSYGRRLVLARAQAHEATLSTPSSVAEPRGHSRGFSRSKSLGFIPFGKKE